MFLFKFQWQEKIKQQSWAQLWHDSVWWVCCWLCLRITKTVKYSWTLFILKPTQDFPFLFFLMSFQIHTECFCPAACTHIKYGFRFAVWKQRSGTTWSKADNGRSLWQGGHFICFCSGTEIKPSFDFHTWSWVFLRTIALPLQTCVQIKGLAPALGWGLFAEWAEGAASCKEAVLFLLLCYKLPQCFCVPKVLGLPSQGGNSSHSSLYTPLISWNLSGIWFRFKFPSLPKGYWPLISLGGSVSGCSCFFGNPRVSPAEHMSSHRDKILSPRVGNPSLRLCHY